MKRVFLYILTMFIFIHCNGVVLAGVEKNITHSDLVVPVSFSTNIHGDMYYNGDVVPITVIEDVFLDNTIVFKKGASGTAEISKVVHSGSHGRAGEIEIREANLVDVNGQKHQLQLNAYAKGESKKASAIALSVIGVCLIFIPFGIWREGEPAYLNGNKIYNAVLIN